jgi:hypothetical protein
MSVKERVQKARREGIRAALRIARHQEKRAGHLRASMPGRLSGPMMEAVYHWQKETADLIESCLGGSKDV